MNNYQNKINPTVPRPTTLQLFVLSWLLLLTVGCASNPTPPPVTEASQPPPIERDAPQEAEAPPATTAATASLLAAADAALAADDEGTAITYLERAVRIAPRDAQLWTRLGQAHLRDGNLGAATQHARKAIALAGANELLTRDAWLLFADIREAEGFAAEARSIRRRYRNVRG